MAYLAGSIARSSQDLTIHDEPGTHSSAERKKDEMPKVRTSPADTEVILSERTRVAVVLNENGQARKFLGESLP